MSETLERFLLACEQVNEGARAAGYPPFTARPGHETPLDSSPYLYPIETFGTAFGTSPNRRRLLASLIARIGALAAAGVSIEVILVGGSFLRTDREPKDIDALALYRLAGRGSASADILRGASRDSSGIDLHLCPADTHPAILLKRVIYFSNTFAYDKATGSLDRGLVMLVPNRIRATLAAA